MIDGAERLRLAGRSGGGHAAGLSDGSPLQRVRRIDDEIEGMSQATTRFQSLDVTLNAV